MNGSQKPGMSARERLQATLEHRQPDRVCVDFGATFVTGMNVCTVHQLRERLLGKRSEPVKVIEPIGICLYSDH